MNVYTQFPLLLLDYCHIIIIRKETRNTYHVPVLLY